MKKLTCLLLALLLLVLALPLGAAADDSNLTYFTPKYIGQMGRTNSQWIVSEQNRCEFAVLMLIELIDGKYITSTDVDSSRDQYVAMADNLLCYACPFETNNSYVLSIYDGSSACAYMRVENCTEYMMRSTLNAYPGIRLYTVDQATFVQTLEAVITTISS